MKTQKYYWTVVILAVLFVFVIAADVAGFIGLFTGGGDATLIKNCISSNRLVVFHGAVIFADDRWSPLRCIWQSSAVICRIAALYREIATALTGFVRTALFERFSTPGMQYSSCI